jgi:alpha-beta hydrolase superfamily lysophospholipase
MQWRRNILTGTLLTAVALMGCACAKPYVYPGGSEKTPPSLHDDYAIMDDGYRLPLSRWQAEGACTRVVLAVHGLNDYRNAFKTTGDYLAGLGIYLVAYDQRGFGDSEGFGFWHGSARLAKDLGVMTRLIRGQYPDCPLYVLGESMGGAVALSALPYLDPEVQGFMLVAPAVWSRSTMPAYQRAALWFAAHSFPDRKFTGESLDIMASDNIEMLRALGRDPKVIKATRADVLYGLGNLMDYAMENPDIGIPRVLLLYGERDEVIPKGPTCTFIDEFAGEPKQRWTVILYPNGYHMLTRDLQAGIVLRDIGSWLLETEPGDTALPPDIADFCPKHRTITHTEAANPDR